MEFTWYETRKIAVLVIYTQQNEGDRQAKQEEGGVRVTIGDSTLFIEIAHQFILDKVVNYQQKMEVILNKPKSEKWEDLVPKPKEFERLPEIQEPEKTPEYTHDPVMNMLMGVYDRASPEAKREMNRSYIESGGQEIRTTPEEEIRKRTA
ncbi:suppressor of G2 allele of SKP1 [Nematocida homosporus]|uniref:suppressor of G2 allele of SKP1 n=1 Tax=Nematocida homosporus TaxID=1912981 RepID=UPI0022212268|nr:suppressor of G2 allele of SKP1 [Nematocida homosporus]KAI5187526.1 suppressor of G2 allele of SKP1 [Nematocida homosporus]